MCGDGRREGADRGVGGDHFETDTNPRILESTGNPSWEIDDAGCYRQTVGKFTDKTYNTMEYDK